MEAAKKARKHSLKHVERTLSNVGHVISQVELTAADKKVMKEQHVPETVMKKRKRDEKVAASVAATALMNKKVRKQTRSIICKKALKYQKEYKDVETKAIAA